MKTRKTIVLVIAATVLFCAGYSNADVSGMLDIEQIAKLTGDATWPGQFGWSVAISGNTAIVGARRDNNAYYSGSAYLFNATTGNQIAKFTANNAGERDKFGHSVAINGNTAVVELLSTIMMVEQSPALPIFSTPLPAIRSPNSTPTTLRRAVCLAVR